MRVGWGLKSVAGNKAENSAYFTPYELAAFDPEKDGFTKIDIDLTPRKVAAVAFAQPTVEEGQRLYQMIGCMACHSIDGSTVGKVGPSWKGIYGAKRIFAKGGDPVLADEPYLHESIVNPTAKVVKGFEKFDTGMPIYAGILNESQIQSIILYIKTLK
jgi:cytochrome c2